MPQHGRGDHLGPVWQVHLGGTLTASSRQPRPDSRVLPASCVTTTTEPGASHGAELHHPGPRPGRRDQHPLAIGQALLNPSAQLTDATDDMIVTKAQLSARPAGSYPQVRLVATDYALFDDYDGMMQCRCGTPSCRATIGGQDWQRPDLRC